MTFVQGIEIDEDKIDDAALALLWLTLHDEHRAWKGFEWDELARLHEKGMILNPVGKAKSAVLTEDGLRRSESLFRANVARAADKRACGAPDAPTYSPMVAPSGPRAGHFVREELPGDGQRP